MKIHIIAVGGRIMHTLAILLSREGHEVTGSDDEIYEPSRSRLANEGILPDSMGWDSDRVKENLELVILGMHARADNPELKKALELGLDVVSYPEFIYRKSLSKKRVVVAGSHGKTTTTAMIMHVLKYRNFDFDYLIGAELEGFNSMIRLSEAPLIIIEGDEYLSSSIDRRPKMIHYQPHISVITGIAWDHVNVFKSEGEYQQLFVDFINTHNKDAPIFTYGGDEDLNTIVDQLSDEHLIRRYAALERLENNNVVYENKQYRIKVFGQHNRSNMMAALQVCIELGVRPPDFFAAISTFKGAAKRMELLLKSDKVIAYRDFAHAPSKVKATVQALKEHFRDRRIICFLELHTFSSLNKEFLPQYEGSLSAADEAFVYYSKHTLEIKKMPQIDKQEVVNAFNMKDLVVVDDEGDLLQNLKELDVTDSVLVFMSSGNFDKIDLKGILIEKL